MFVRHCADVCRALDGLCQREGFARLRRSGELVEVAQETAQKRGFFRKIVTLTIVSQNDIIVS
jgi:hypothetical protein